MSVYDCPQCFDCPCTCPDKIPLCRNCKHWGGPIDRLDRNTRRSCQMITLITEHAPSTDLVEFEVVSDHEWYGVGLVTAADFGCRLFERKDPK